MIMNSYKIEFIRDISWTMNSYMNSCIWRISCNIPEIMCTKVPDGHVCPSSLGVRVTKSWAWLLFFQYFWQFKGKTLLSLLRYFCSDMLYNGYNHAHVSGQHMWLSPCPCPNSKCSKTMEVGCSGFNCYITTNKIGEREKGSKHNNIKVQVSVHWMAQCHAKWPRGCRAFRHPAGIEPVLPYSLQLALTTQPRVCNWKIQ